MAAKIRCVRQATVFLAARGHLFLLCTPRPFKDVLRMCSEVVYANTLGPAGGVLGSAFNAAFRAVHGEGVQLSFGSQRLKLKELLAHCTDVEVVVRNTQPLYRTAAASCEPAAAAAAARR